MSLISALHYFMENKDFCNAVVMQVGLQLLPPVCTVHALQNSENTIWNGETFILVVNW